MNPIILMYFSYHCSLMFSSIYLLGVYLGNSQLDEITTRGIWKTKKLSPLLPNYFRLLPSTITHSQRRWRIPWIDEWMDGRTDGRTGGEWLAG